MSELDIAKDVLFVGRGQSAVAYYRCMLPARALGCDWLGVGGDPPNLRYATGLCRRADGKFDSMLPDMSKYRAIVVQQPATKGWREAFKSLRERGVKIIYEIDDYIHGIPSMGKDEHDFHAEFDKAYLWEVEQTMKRTDALIASTDFIASEYRHFNKRTFVCRNGIDLRRYDLTIPERETINIGWAGATGHIRAVIPWFQQLAHIMRFKPEVNFVSIGQPFAKGFAPHFPEDRYLAIPWAQIEQYPAAMTMFDVALAPGGQGGWWRGKSDLRWLEAGALGIPTIVNPEVYPDVVDGETGFTAVSPQEAGEKMMMLIRDRELRTRVGKQARLKVRTDRSMQAMAPQWERVLREVVE